MIKIIIDADTGIDDSLAILHALKNPEIQVLGICTGCGNTSAEQAAENTLRLIKLANVDEEVPVVIGARKPLQRAFLGGVEHVHGKNGIGNVKLEKSLRKCLDVDASDFIYETAKKHFGEVVLITLGRLTTLALTLDKYPDLKKYLNRVVSMGGTVYAPGNVGPNSEANFHGDPEAADIVFTSGLDVTVVGLDVTMKTRLTKEHIEHLKEFGREDCKDIIAYLDEALKYYMNFNRVQDFAMNDCPVHDPLAIIAVTSPNLYTIKKMKARVECNGDFSVGRVVVDNRSHSIDAPYINFCIDVDSKQAVNKLLSIFCRQY